MYKSRFIAWGWRKNIRLKPADENALRDLFAEAATNTTIAAPETGNVRLRSGQVVDIDRLAEHLWRRGGRFAHAAKDHIRQSHTAQISRVIRPPDSLYGCELICSYNQAVVLGLLQSIGTVGETNRILAAWAAEDGLDGLNSWSGYSSRVTSALHQTNLDEALVWIRQGPDAIDRVTPNRKPQDFLPMALVGCSYALIVQISRYRKANSVQSRRFWESAKDVLIYGTTVVSSVAPTGPTQAPQALRGLALVPEEDLAEVAMRAWAALMKGFVTQFWPDIGNHIDFAAESVVHLRRWMASDTDENPLGIMLAVLTQGLSRAEMTWGRNDHRTAMSREFKAGVLGYQAVMERKNWPRQTTAASPSPPFDWKETEREIKEEASPRNIHLDIPPSLPHIRALQVPQSIMATRFLPPPEALTSPSAYSPLEPPIRANILHYSTRQLAHLF